jgi:hypothetical protein
MPGVRRLPISVGTKVTAHANQPGRRVNCRPLKKVDRVFVLQHCKATLIQQLLFAQKKARSGTFLAQ